MVSEETRDDVHNGIDDPLMQDQDLGYVFSKAKYIHCNIYSVVLWYLVCTRSASILGGAIRSAFKKFNRL